MGLTQRISRWLFGVLLISWAVAGGPIWAYGGIYLLATGAWAYCPLFRLALRLKKQN